MNQIHRIVRQAATRLMLQDWLRIFGVALTVALALAILARLTEQAFGLSKYFSPWWLKGSLVALGAVVLVTTIAAFIRRPRPIRAAQTLDERAGLRETLSTAMYIERLEDSWSRAMVAEAAGSATKVRVANALPYEMPRQWPVPVCTGAALALIWITVPNMDLLGIHKEKVAQEQKAAEVQQVKADIAQKQQKLEEMLQKAKVDVKEEKGESEAGQDKKPEANDPEALRRAAVRKLTSLTEKLEAQKESDKSEQLAGLKDAMKQLRQPGDGPLDQFSRSLARGDFNKAQEQLSQMSKELASNDMTPEAREAAKKQMENLAKQMEKLAENQKELARKLEQKGLDKKTAEELAKKAASASKEEMKKALEDAKSLTEEQKQEMMKMCESAGQCSQSMSDMAQAMAKAAKGMTQEGLQQDGMEGMSDLAKELSGAEMLESDMQQLDAALEEAKAQLAELGNCLGGDCNGEGRSMGPGKVGGWREGSSQRMGNGTGGPGHGSGPSPDAQATDYTVEKKKADIKTTQGPIIGTRLVYGQQVKGDSVAEFAEVVESSSNAAAEALETQQVPREYHDAVKHYFGTLQEKVKKEKAPDAPKPAGDAKPADKPADKGK